MSDRLERANVLLKATLEILRKCDEGPFVKNVLEETAFYDEAECDGYCLIDDIDNWLKFEAAPPE